MAKTKLKSVFTREDVYTVLQLLKALADGVDDNEALTDEDIKKLQDKVLTSVAVVSIDTDHKKIVLTFADNTTIESVPFESGSTYYQHTVRIHFSSNTTSPTDICFTALSTKNTPVNSYQDLHTIFGGRNLSLSGNAIFWAGSNMNNMNVLYLDLHGGTIETDNIVGSDIADLHAVPLSTYVSKEGAIVITDNVCPL